MNRLLRQLIKAAAVAGGLSTRQRSAGIRFLIYHKVGALLPLDIDLPQSVFRRQLEFLGRTGRVVAYEQALALLRNGDAPPDDLFVLTFDDGYEDFYTHVFHLLREFDLPAVLFLTTGFVEGEIASPLTQKQLPVRPVTWDMLGRIHASGLVTLGAHAHTHPDLVDEPTERVVEELERPIELFQNRLGLRPRHFAYPHAIWDERTERVVKQYYCSAAIGTGQKATAANFDPYRIPRIPVRASDRSFFFRLKMHGWLEAEEGLYNTLHKLLRI